MAKKRLTNATDDATDNAVPSRGRGAGAPLVYETIRREILEMKLAPGALLEEAQIGKRFNLSRSPVREALIRLSAEGLARTLPNKNTLVAPLNLEDFPHYVDALDVVQRLTTRLAAEHRSDSDLTEIRRRQELFETAIANHEVLEMIECNRNFHIAIAEAAGNRYLTDFNTRLLDEGRRMQRIYFKSFGDTLPEEFNAEHLEIIKAIEARDCDLAERLAHEHTMQVSERFLNILAKRRASGFTVRFEE